MNDYTETVASDWEKEEYRAELKATNGMVIRFSIPKNKNIRSSITFVGNDRLREVHANRNDLHVFAFALRAALSLAVTDGKG